MNVIETTGLSRRFRRTWAAFLRPHFRTPITVAISPDSKLADWGTVWSLSNWWTAPDGKRVGQPALNALARRISAENIDTSTWLTRHHYVFWESYQPGSRFWEFQIIEGTGLVILSLMLAAAAAWWVRRAA